MASCLQLDIVARRAVWFAVVVGGILLLPLEPVLGQANIPQWSPYRPAPPPLEPTAPQTPLSLHQPAAGPQWVLVRNRDTSTGLPPYALADAQGKLVRYVEPSPGIPIESYLGQSVQVRHDTGKVLLSSQLVVVGGPAAGHPGVALADHRPPAANGPQSLEGSHRPLDRAELMAQQLLGENDVVHDRGPMESFFEWAGGKRLGRFISVGEPRRDDASPDTTQNVATSPTATRHTTASSRWIPPQRW